MIGKSLCMKRLPGSKFFAVMMQNIGEPENFQTRKLILMIVDKKNNVAEIKLNLPALSAIVLQ